MFCTIFYNQERCIRFFSRTSLHPDYVRQTGLCLLIKYWYLCEVGAIIASMQGDVMSSGQWEAGS